MEVLPASGGSSRPSGVLAQRLRAGQIAVLVCDLDVTGGGIEVNFFGEKGPHDRRPRRRSPSMPAQH